MEILIRSVKISGNHANTGCYYQLITIINKAEVYHRPIGSEAPKGHVAPPFSRIIKIFLPAMNEGTYKCSHFPSLEQRLKCTTLLQPHPHPLKSMTGGGFLGSYLYFPVRIDGQIKKKVFLFVVCNFLGCWIVREGISSVCKKCAHKDKFHTCFLIKGNIEITSTDVTLPKLCKLGHTALGNAGLYKIKCQSFFFFVYVLCMFPH